MEDLLAQLEGKYELLEKLQEGGMGAIFKVRHRLLDELRVVKVIRPQLQQHDGIEARFRREAQAAARLNHPNIARIFDFTLDEKGVACIVMEYIPGITLGDLIRAGQLPPIDLALEIARQSLRAIGYIHQQKIIHRDVSPDNLMLTLDVEGAPLVKLIDLGLVKVMEGGGSQLTGAGIFVGKFRYAAPELFEVEGRGESRRSDIYAFALVLYELLTGRFPISGDNPSSLIAGHLFRQPLDFSITDPEGRIPADIRAAIRRGLAKRPDERFESADAFATVLGAEDVLDPQVPEVQRILDLTRGTKASQDAASDNLPPSPPLASSQAVTAARLPEAEKTTVEFPAVKPLEQGEESVSPQQADADPALPEETSRGQEVSDPSAHIEALVMSGDLAAARVALDQLPEEDGTAALRELRFRLDEIETIANRPQVLELLEKARQESAQDRPEQALSLLEEAHRLGPADDQVVSLLAATQRAVNRQREEHERERLVAQQAEVVADHLTAERFERAAQELERGEEVFGPTQRFRQLREELKGRLGQARASMEPTRTLAEPRSAMQGVEEQVETSEAQSSPSPEENQESLQERASALVEEARRHARAEEFERAQELLLKSLDLVPDHREAAESLAAVSSCLEALRQETEQTAALERTVTDIRNLLGTGRSGEALASLERAVVTFGDQKELDALRFQAAEAQLEVDESEAQTTLIATQSIQQEDAAPELRTPTLAETMEEIRALASGNEAGRALGVLQRAVQLHGDLPVLRELRAELGRALLDQDAAQSAGEELVDSERGRPTQGYATVPPAPDITPSELADLTLGGRLSGDGVSAQGHGEGQVGSGPLGVAGEVPGPAQQGRGGGKATVPGKMAWGAETAESGRESPSGPMELGFGGPSSGSMPAQTPQRRDLPGRQTSRNMVLTAVFVVAVLVVLVMIVGRVNQQRNADSVEVPVEEVPVVDLAPGFLAIDATPWAEVVEIVDLGGGEAPPLVPSRFTPVVFTLPSGQYRLTLRDPSGAETQELVVEIESGARREERHDWREVEVRQYFKAAGY